MVHNNCHPFGSIDAKWRTMVQVDVRSLFPSMLSVLALAGCSMTITKALSIVLMSLLTKKHEVWVRVQSFLLANCAARYKTAKATFICVALVYNRSNRGGSRSSFRMTTGLESL